MRITLEVMEPLMKSHSTGPFGFRVAEPFLLSQHVIFMSPRVAFGPLKSPLIASTTHQITHQRGDWLANPGPFTSPTSLAKWGRGRCASFLPFRAFWAVRMPNPRVPRVSECCPKLPQSVHVTHRVTQSMRRQGGAAVRSMVRRL